METYDVSRAKEAQKVFCEAKNFPHFAPHSGICWKCGCNIYEQVTQRGYGDKERITGISVEAAGSHLITGCPHCNRSYCD